MSRTGSPQLELQKWKCLLAQTEHFSQPISSATRYTSALLSQPHQGICTTLFVCSQNEPQWPQPSSFWDLFVVCLFGFFSTMSVSHGSFPPTSMMLPERPDTGLGPSHCTPNITVTLLYRRSLGLPGTDFSLLWSYVGQPSSRKLFIRKA